MSYMDAVADFISIPAVCVGVCLAMFAAGIQAIASLDDDLGLRSGLRAVAAVFLVSSLLLVPVMMLIAAAARLISEAT